MTELEKLIDKIFNKLSDDKKLKYLLYKQEYFVEDYKAFFILLFLGILLTPVLIGLLLLIVVITCFPIARHKKIIDEYNYSLIKEIQQEKD